MHNSLYCERNTFLGDILQREVAVSVFLNGPCYNHEITT